MRQRRTLLAMTCLLAVAACTSNTEPGPAPNPPAQDLGASYAATPCPDDVRGFVFGDVECGLLTVPERRAGSTETIGVFVTRVRPPGATPGREPIVVVPAVGGVPNYLGISPLAQRTGREVIIVDGRGIGHSQPLLECPEVSDAAQRALALPARDPSVRADHLEAVDACADRLRADGIDPAAFTITETAADLADLRRELGIDSWAVASYGNAARFVPELMRLDADGVSALVLDSPELPGMDPIRIAVEETPQVVEALLAECAQHAPCAARYPRAPELWTAARRAVAREPMHLTAGALGQVLLDEALLIRIVRQVISDGGSSGLAYTPGSVPGVLQDVVDRGGARLEREIAPLLAQQDSFCLGYSAHCLNRMHVTVGTYLSVMCHDIVPSTRTPATPSDPTIERVFRARVDTEVCARWNAGSADDLGAPVDWDAPTLIFVGRFAPYTPVNEVRRAVAALPNGSLLVDPGGADNVIPRTECALTLRGKWLDNPARSVLTPECLSSERVQWNLS